MACFMKSGNFEEPIVPANDGIFIFSRDKVIITIGDPLYGTKIIDDILWKIYHKKINVNYFPIMFNERITDELFYYLKDQHDFIKAPFDALNQTISFGLEDSNKTIKEKISVFFRRKEYIKKHLSDTQLKILDNAGKFYQAATELNGYIDKKGAAVFTYCNNNQFSYISKSNLVRLYELNNKMQEMLIKIVELYKKRTEAGMNHPL